MRLKFTHSAQRDLIRLREFIALKNPQAAHRIGQRLRKSIQKLTSQPEMGVEVEDLPEVRDWISGDYIVRYTIMEKEIVVLRVWHGKENY